MNNMAIQAFCNFVHKVVPSGLELYGIGLGLGELELFDLVITVEGNRFFWVLARLSARPRMNFCFVKARISGCDASDTKGLDRAQYAQQFDGPQTYGCQNH